MEDVKMGIYLEVKKGVIGTGHTAKSTEYRNLWMTLLVKEEEVICAHLDNDFKPTGIKQTMTIGDFTGGRFTYIPQGDQRYQAMMTALKEGAKKKLEQQKAKAAAPAKVEKKAANWWESSKKEDIKPGDIFKRPEKGKASSNKKSSTEVSTKKNWWE